MEDAHKSQSTNEHPLSGRASWALSPALALAAGLSLRLWMLKQFFQVNGDTLTYGDLAKNLLRYGRYALTASNGEIYPTLIRLPGYPLFLALNFRLFGMENYVAVAWVQIALDLAGCLLLAVFAGRIAPPALRRGAALCTLWLAALCPFTAIYAAQPLTEAPTLFVLALALWSAARFRHRPGWPSALSFTFAVTYAALLRPDGALAALALAPALLFGLKCNEGGGAATIDSSIKDKQPQTCHPERSEAESKDLRLFLSLFGSTALGRINNRKLLRMAVACLLLALTPFAVWSGRNWRVFHVFEPLAPRYANDPGENPYPGWQLWMKTWSLDFVSTYDIYWNVPGGPLDLTKLPRRAFDSPAQYAETAALAAAYKNNGQDFTPSIDARFAQLATERTHAHPLRTYLWLPLGRVADMALRPRVDNLPIDLDWWVYAHHNAETCFSWAYAGLNALYLLLALAGLWLKPQFWRPMLAYLLLRCALMATIEAPETRYTLEFFPIFFALGGLAFYRFTYCVLPSVLKVKASAGKG
jgi:hypothetical protein